MELLKFVWTYSSSLSCLFPHTEPWQNTRPKQKKKSKPRPQPFDPAAPPWLLAPSSPPWPVSPPAPPGSLVPLAPPWSVFDHLPPRASTPPATPRPSDSVRLLLPSGSTLVLCLSGSTAAFRIPASGSVAWAICSALALRILPIALAHRLSVSTSGSTSTCSATVGRPPGVVSPSSTISPPSVGSTVGRHHGCGLGPAWFLLLQVPHVLSLAPPSVWSTLDFGCCPPPRCPSSAGASTCLVLSRIRSMNFRSLTNRGHLLSTWTLTLHKLLHYTLDYISHHPLHWFHPQL